MALAIFVSGPRATIVVGARAHAYQQQQRRPSHRFGRRRYKLALITPLGFTLQRCSGLHTPSSSQPSYPRVPDGEGRGCGSSPPAAPAAAAASLGIQTGDRRWLRWGLLGWHGPAPALGPQSARRTYLPALATRSAALVATCSAAFCSVLQHWYGQPSAGAYRMAPVPLRRPRCTVGAGLPKPEHCLWVGCQCWPVLRVARGSDARSGRPYLHRYCPASAPGLACGPNPGAMREAVGRRPRERPRSPCRPARVLQFRCARDTRQRAVRCPRASLRRLGRSALTLRRFCNLKRPGLVNVCARAADLARVGPAGEL
jgi:hypothetical protein